MRPLAFQPSRATSDPDAVESPVGDRGRPLLLLPIGPRQRVERSHDHPSVAPLITGSSMTERGGSPPPVFLGGSTCPAATPSGFRTGSIRVSSCAAMGTHDLSLIGGTTTRLEIIGEAPKRRGVVSRAAARSRSRSRLRAVRERDREQIIQVETRRTANQSCASMGSHLTMPTVSFCIVVA